MVTIVATSTAIGLTGFAIGIMFFVLLRMAKHETICAMDLAIAVFFATLCALIVLGVLIMRAQGITPHVTSDTQPVGDIMLIGKEFLQI